MSECACVDVVTEGGCGGEGESGQDPPCHRHLHVIGE